MPLKRRRRREQPHKILHLSTYKRLEEYLQAFAKGHFHLLILVGAGGLAKSRSVKAVLGDRPRICVCSPIAPLFSLGFGLFGQGPTLARATIPSTFRGAAGAAPDLQKIMRQTDQLPLGRYLLQSS